MPVQTLTTPGGETLVVLTLEEYEDLIDARDGNYAALRLATGQLESSSAEETAANLKMPARLGFWRAHWGVSLESVASATNIPVHELAAIEDGDASDPATLARISAYLDHRAMAIKATSPPSIAGSDAAE